MDRSGVEFMKAYLLSYVHSITNVAPEPPKPPEPQREYKIPLANSPTNSTTLPGNGARKVSWWLPSGGDQL